MSINKASQLAKGKYIARMDADDIATTDRLEKEYNIIKKGTVDLVCSNFYFIDEESRLLSRKFDFLTKKQLIKLLPVWNTVHHPTIMMKREVFLKLGGFRDFPCAQDYDLWLRMLSEKYTFLMLEEKLLKYRIRSNSTTSSKLLLQVLTMNYAKKLYKERKIDGEDHYSPLDYENFLKNNGYYDERYCNEIEKKRLVFLRYKAAVNKKKYIQGFVYLSGIVGQSKYFRNRFFTVLEFELKKKYFKYFGG